MSEANAPAPSTEAVFHVEPHPDPLVQSLIEQVEQLRRDNSELRSQLDALGKGLGLDGPHSR